MGTTILALLLANGPFASAYEHAVHTRISIDIGSWGLKMSL